ncbi:MAG: MarR family transcriptional regulator [Acidimicrobiia bacterium]
MRIELKKTPASETWRAMMTAFTRVNKLLALEMDDETEISLDWYSILLMLSQGELGVMRLSEVADQVGLSRSATTRLIDRLERDGLVERRACGTDRRGTYVGLTPQGEETFRRAGRIHLRGINEHVGTHLTSTELSQLEALLTTLADGVQGKALFKISAETPD